MVIVLGTIVFSDWEVPEQISFGGKHQIARHTMIGGKTIIDAMGPQDTDLAWDGIFLHEWATLRARRVDLLRRSGRKVILTWGSFIYEVIVVGFRADYRRSNYIPFRVECAVLRDLVSDTLGPAVERMEDALRQTIADAIGATGDNPLLLGATTGIQAGIMQMLTGGRPTLAGLGVAAAAGLQATAANSFAAANGVAAASDTSLTGSEAIKAGKDPALMASDFQARAGAAQASSQAHQTAAHLGRAQAQIAIPLPPPPAPPVTGGALDIPLPPPPAPVPRHDFPLPWEMGP